MSNMDAFLYDDLIRRAVEYDSDTIIKVSSQANPTKFPINRTNCSGSAEYSFKGGLSAPDTIDIAIKIHALGSPGSSLVGVNPMPTVPRAGKTNTGDGEITVLATPNTKKSFDLTFRCISASEETAGVNASADSADYLAEANQGGIEGHIYGARYDNNRSGEEGGTGDGASIAISQGSTLYPWSSAASGLRNDGAITTEMYWLKFNANPTGTLSEGDLIQFGSSTAKAHIILIIAQNDVGDWYAAFWPRPLATIPDLTNIYKVSASSGFLVECKNPSGANLVIYEGYTTDGGTTTHPIRNLQHLKYVLNDGMGVDKGGVVVASVGYEIRTDESYTLWGAPPHAETLTFANGVDGGTYALFAPESSQPVTLEHFLADGTSHTLGSGTDYETKVTITAGDIPFVEGDYFSLQMIQAQIKTSFDGESTWSSVMDVNDGGTGDQDATAEISIGNSIVLKVELSEDETPFVSGDKILSVMGYRNGWRELADNLRSGKWRTKTCTSRQAILIDLGIGNTQEVDYLALIDHNLQTGSNKVKFLGIADADIETCYGETTSASYYSGTGQTVINVNPESAPGSNDHQGGYLVFTGGGAMGKAYSIDSNTASQYTVAGDCISDGANASGGDNYIIIPPDSYADFVAQDVSVTDNAIHGQPIATLTAQSFTGRGFILVFNDPTNPDGFIEMSFCLLGKRMIPQTSNGSPEMHNYIEGKTRTGFAIELRNEAGEPVKGARGVGTYKIPLEYFPVSTNCRDQLDAMNVFANNYSRVIPVAFWKDTDNRNDVIMGYIEDMTISTVKTSAGGIHSVTFDLVTLETE